MKCTYYRKMEESWSQYWIISSFFCLYKFVIDLPHMYTFVSFSFVLLEIESITFDWASMSLNISHYCFPPPNAPIFTAAQNGTAFEPKHKLVHSEGLTYRPVLAPSVGISSCNNLKKVGQHLLPNMIPSNFTAGTGRKLWCDRVMIVINIYGK